MPGRDKELKGLWQHWDEKWVLELWEISAKAGTSPVRKEPQGPSSGLASWDEGLAVTGGPGLEVHPILGPVPCGFRLPLLQIPTCFQVFLETFSAALSIMAQERVG